MSTALSVRRPRESAGDKHTRIMQEAAARLERLCGGEMTIDFSAGSYFGEDHESRNQLISGHLTCDSEADFVMLDARKGKLRRQLVKELERIAKLYKSIARRVKGGRYED